MQLGIYAPYNLSETTTAAINLATLALAMDMQVAYLVTGERMARVHDFWDARVRSNRADYFEKWAAQNHRCVWFHPSRQRLEQALQIRTNTSHTLVVPWHQLEEQHVTWLHWYDHVVCPSPEVEYRITTTSGHLEFAALTCPWPSGLNQTVRDGLWCPDQVKFFLPIGAATQKTNGGRILWMAEALLTNNENALLTIVPSRTWPRDLRRKVNWLCGLFPGRFYCLPNLNLPERLQAAREHDCVLFLDTQVNLGIEVARYKSAGLPVVTWEAEPASYLVEHNVDGILLPCDVNMNVWGAECVIFDATRVLARCADLCREPRQMIKLMHGNIGESAADSEFNRVWGQLLDPVMTVEP